MTRFPPPVRPCRIPACLMRGGTSKGLFFLEQDLPDDPDLRDRLLIRAVGSPDPYRQHMDGLGGATSSTSKVVLVGPSTHPGCDVNYRFGAVAVDRAVIDWSGNCGNLSAAVAPFALHRGLVRVPRDGVAVVRIWQADIRKVIVAHIPVADGAVVEDGDFQLDGVAFPGAEIRLDFLDPAGDGEALFPTGHRRDTLSVAGLGNVDATLINAGNPTVFVHADTLGLTGTELQRDVNGQLKLLARAEALRAAAAVAMGLALTADEATRNRPHTPKLAYVAAPAPYVASDGRQIVAGEVDLLVRIFSMGPLHHAMTGTGAVAIAVAAAIPGTLVHEVARVNAGGRVCFGHPSGTLTAGADAQIDAAGNWVIRQVSMSRSARRLMDGQVFIPAV
ncbi:MAG TPA: 2-methylaconitate cis-trans isomerase PrpF [Rhodocyclaceae bacterium]|nr:2-methylaconitate cis-trans isomerase PrpF [Rhodocyclaceae bacterium]